MCVYVYVCVYVCVCVCMCVCVRARMRECLVYPNVKSASIRMLRDEKESIKMVDLRHFVAQLLLVCIFFHVVFVATL